MCLQQRYATHFEGKLISWQIKKTDVVYFTHFMQL